MTWQQKKDVSRIRGCSSEKDTGTTESMNSIEKNCFNAFIKKQCCSLAKCSKILQFNKTTQACGIQQKCVHSLLLSVQTSVLSYCLYMNTALLAAAYMSQCHWGNGSICSVAGDNHIMTPWCGMYSNSHKTGKLQCLVKCSSTLYLRSCAAK
jgi:hypothetical protein